MTRPPRILIVDDERMIVDYLEEYLQRLGYETVSAANGRDALEKVAADSPDLILLDIVIPVIDGFKVCRILKGDEATRLIPIVIMTALDGIEERIKGIEAGADDYLAKPINPRELTARIETALRLKSNVDLKMSELHRIKDHFAKFVPEAVKRLVSANPTAPELAKRERDLSILFLDISGYADLSQRLPPQTLNTLVERYFSTFLNRIQESGGDINETAGDGFMAIFQDADPDAHAATTTDTALGLLIATEALNRESSEHPLSVHMGINSGVALVGSTRFDGLRGTRWTFTASGSVTNLAARLAAAAAPGQILAGPETVRRLRDRYRLERLGPQHLKNILEDVEVHRVLGPS
ncbi:MAG: response regulator [Candidatus Rokubacteria bacterium]|nr:response regulator [Candidatus Rokubacteria bacterium]